MAMLTKKDIFSIALGSVIGWGAFILPGNIFLPKYGVVNTLLGFSIAIFMLFFIEKNYMKVMAKVPKSGGEYSFATELLGRKIGFITGWGLLLAYISIIPLNATAVPMVLDTVFPFYSRGLYLYSISGYPVYLNDIIVSLCVVIFFTALNVKGIKGALTAQNILVFSLLSSLLVIAILTTFNLGSVELDNLDSNWGQVEQSSIIRIIAFAPWAFIGFDAVAQLSGDHKLPSKTVSRMTMIAIILGAVIYNLLNIVTAVGLNSEQLTSSSWATGDAVKLLIGNEMFYFLAIAMFGAVISGLNGFFISSSRLISSMSSDFNIGPKIVILQDGSVNTPKWVMYFIGVCAMVVPFFGRTALLWFVDLASVGASIAYFMTCLCAYKISCNRQDKIISCMGMLVSLAFLVFLLTPFFDSNISLPSYFSLLFWVLFGISVYSFAKKRTSNKAI